MEAVNSYKIDILYVIVCAPYIRILFEAYPEVILYDSIVILILAFFLFRLLSKYLDMYY